MSVWDQSCRDLGVHDGGPFARAASAASSLPVGSVVTDVLPRTITGKTEHRSLRASAVSPTSGAAGR